MLVALKNLLTERLRLATSLVGVTFAVVLVMVMAGIYLGTLGQVTTYIDHTDSEGQVWVAQPGVDQMFRSVSWLDAAVVDQVSALPEAESASPVLGVPTSFDHDGELTAYYLVGYDPGDDAVGPWKISEGRSVQQSGEAVMDSVLAASNDIHVGDTVTLVDQDFTVVGLSDQTAAVGNFYVFVPREDAAEQLRAQGRVSYVLATPAAGVASEELRDAVASNVTDVEVLTAGEFADNSRTIVTSMVGRPLLAMIAIGIMVGLALVTLTILSMTSEQMRDFGVLRAIGARPRQLYLTVIIQALILASAGCLLGVLLTYGLQHLLEGRLGDVAIAVPAWLITVMAGGTLVMAVVGSLLPARRVSKIDPADAFRT